MMPTKKICLCSSLLPSCMTEILEKTYTVIPLMPDCTIAEPVRCHPDMLCTVMDDRIFFPRIYAEEHPDIVHAILAASGLQAILTDLPRSAQYPCDVGLNAAVLPDALVCRTASTAPELLDAAEKSGRQILDVKQGYAACSCLVYGRAVLTSDPGIHRKLLTHGTDCTLFPNDGILLPGYNIGFIGGCGGADDGTLYLFGSPDSVKSGSILADFAHRFSLTLRPLCDAPLTDYGGLKFL